MFCVLSCQSQGKIVSFRSTIEKFKKCVIAGVLNSEILISGMLFASADGAQCTLLADPLVIVLVREDCSPESILKSWSSEIPLETVLF